MFNSSFVPVTPGTKTLRRFRDDRLHVEESKKKKEEEKRKILHHFLFMQSIRL